ncbi:hypothetical protein GEMRC1_000531 [Eukaryota sp. GEM-RC1]
MQMQSLWTMVLLSLLQLGCARMVFHIDAFSSDHNSSISRCLPAASRDSVVTTASFVSLMPLESISSLTQGDEIVFPLKTGEEIHGTVTFKREWGVHWVSQAFFPITVVASP